MKCSEDLQTMTPDPAEVLEGILEGELLTEAELMDLMKLNEGQHLEFKDGQITRKERRKEGRVEIRHQINGFANAVGGLLILGVSDKKPRTVSPCERQVGKEPLDKWAEGLIHDMLSSLSPPPRFQVLVHDEGPVLVIAVPRAPQLVPCVEAGDLTYFMRMNHSTVEVPRFLLSDMTLGRRQHPNLSLVLDGIGFVTQESGPPMASFTLYVELRNESLVYVDELQIGLVTWALSQQSHSLNPNLASYVDMNEPTGTPDYRYQWYPRHILLQSYPRTRTILRPFTNHMYQSEEGFKLRVQLMRSENAKIPYVQAAVYVLPRGSEPVWYQLSFDSRLAGTTYNGRLDNGDLRRATKGRPRVALTSGP